MLDHTIVSINCISVCNTHRACLIVWHTDVFKLVSAQRCTLFLNCGLYMYAVKLIVYHNNFFFKLHVPCTLSRKQKKLVWKIAHSVLPASYAV